MLSGDGNENGQNKISRSTQKKKQLCRVQHNFFSCTFLCRCFARLQRETSRNFLVTRFVEQMSYVFLFPFFFSLPLMTIFTSVAASISHFLTAGIKISQFSHFQRTWSPLFFISQSSFFSVIHINVDIEIQSKERIGFVVFVVYSL